MRAVTGGGRMIEAFRLVGWEVVKPGREAS